MDTVMKERDVLGEESVNPVELSPTSGFFFTSAYRSLSTEGCLLKVTASAADGDAIDGEFQRAIKTALSMHTPQASSIQCCAGPFLLISACLRRCLCHRKLGGWIAHPQWRAQ